MTDTTYIRIRSAIATRIFNEDDTFTGMTEWNGDIEFDGDIEDLYRMFNRVTQADSDRLEALGYFMPSMSVGDIVTLGSTTYQCASVGFVPLDPPSPCGYCRRCSLHDDPSGCLEVEKWEQEVLATLR